MTISIIRMHVNGYIVGTEEGKQKDLYEVLSCVFLTNNAYICTYIHIFYLLIYKFASRTFWFLSLFFCFVTKVSI